MLKPVLDKEFIPAAVLTETSCQKQKSVFHCLERENGFVFDMILILSKKI